MSTIFALATPWGKSGVSVIRISGARAFEVFNFFKVVKHIKPRFVNLCKLYKGDGELIDEVLAIYFPEPKSFTGENLVELHLHGSISVIRTVLKELSNFFVPAMPGEFSLRAFLNNKIDLTRAEAIADLINSDTEIQAKQALDQMSGKTELLYKNWRNVLIEIYASIEAYIDFPEEITEDALTNIESQLSELKNSLMLYLNDSHQGELIKSGINIVIAGEPNVGKSTLFNCLAKKDIAIVSEYAGTTRDSLEIHLDIGGYSCIVTDTAGIRESNDPVELQGIEKTNAKVRDASFKIIMFSYHDKDRLNSNILSLIDNNTICVFSKADDVDAKDQFIQDIRFKVLSVHQNKGIKELIQYIQEKIEYKFPATDIPIITSNRHRNHLQKTISILERSDVNQPIEILSEELRLAIQELGKVTGIVTHDDILDTIFSKFCLGK